MILFCNLFIKQPSQLTNAILSDFLCNVLLTFYYIVYFCKLLIVTIQSIGGSTTINAYYNNYITPVHIIIITQRHQPSSAA